MPWLRDSCKHLVNFDGTNISVSGLESQNEIKFKLGAFRIKKEPLQAAIDIAQMYDMYQYSNCQKIKRFPKDSPETIAFMREVAQNEERLLEFLTMLKIAINRPSDRIEHALEEWVSFVFVKRLHNESPIIPDKVRAGELVRESPPIHQYNKIKRSIAKARSASPYFKRAIKNPKFDIHMLYTLSLEEQSIKKT